MLEKIERGIRVGDFVYLTKAGAGKLPELAKIMPAGGIVKEIEGGVATVEIICTLKIHITYLIDPITDDAYDGLQIS